MELAYRAVASMGWLPLLRQGHDIPLLLFVEGHQQLRYDFTISIRFNCQINQLTTKSNMPAYYDKPAAFANATVEDADRFQKLPFYLVKNEVKQFPIWNVFEQLLGDVDWQPNEGNTMRGVTPQRSPVGRAFFFPNPITTAPNKDIHQVTESIEQAVVYMHDYESYQFNFLPSFNSFWKNYLQFANKDIVEKIAISNNQFIETQMWQAAQNIYLAGTGIVTGSPTGAMNSTYNAAGSKTASWLAATVLGSNSNAGVTQGLTLRDVYNAALALQEDFAAPAFESARNMPIDNEGLKGKYVLITSTEAWMNFTFDPDVQTLKPLDLNLLFQDFRGLLFGTTTVKFHRYPIRFNTVDVKGPDGTTVLYAAGTPIAPEIFDATDNKWKPNPYYTSLLSAPIEIAWMLGADYGKSIKVGPPPKEFTSTNMAAEKFYSLRWNGEVRLTDQVLIQYADSSYDLNHYGKQLKFISEATHGYLPAERRYGFPILFFRKRPNRIAA